jgi:hypothetical protein
MFMNAPADYVATLALNLARSHGLRAEAYELAVKAEDLAEWHDVSFEERLRFVRTFCAECNRLWDSELI